MTKYIKIAMCLVALTMTVSCNYLDLKPKHSYVDNDMLITYDNALAAVNGTYYPLVAYTDDFGGSFHTALMHRAGFLNATEYHFNEEYTTTASYGSWSAYMDGINNCNFAINGVGSMNGSAFESEEQRTALVAEARLMRAFYNIQQLYSYAKWWKPDTDVNGILVREELSNLSNIDKARSTVGDSYLSIMADLDAAIADCPTLDEWGSARHASKEFAMVLKAKLLLIRGAAPERASAEDLTASLNIVNELLNNLPSNWVIESDMSEMYLNSFDSKENLFVRYNQNWESSKINGGYTYGYGTGYYPGSANYITTSEGNDYPHDPEKFDAGFTAKNLDWIKSDPRWDVTTGIGDNPETWDVGSRYMMTKLYRNGYNNDCDYKFNTYFFRLYELYIMKAELILRTGGSYADALAVLNSVRAMRTNPVLPALSAVNADQVYDLIYKEIVCELYLENGAEYFASLRFESPDGDLYIQYNKKDEGVVFSWDKQCYPMNIDELANNKLMVQTEGYDE